MSPSCQKATESALVRSWSWNFGKRTIWGHFLPAVTRHHKIIKISSSESLLKLNGTLLNQIVNIVITERHQSPQKRSEKGQNGDTSIKSSSNMCDHHRIMCILLRVQFANFYTETLYHSHLFGLSSGLPELSLRHPYP